MVSPGIAQLLTNQKPLEVIFSKIKKSKVFNETEAFVYKLGWQVELQGTQINELMWTRTANEDSASRKTMEIKFDSVVYGKIEENYF